jgi:hypothetical protein
MKKRYLVQSSKIDGFVSTSYKKDHVIRRNLKIPNARVSRFVD